MRGQPSCRKVLHTHPHAGEQSSAAVMLITQRQTMLLKQQLAASHPTAQRLTWIMDVEPCSQQEPQYCMSGWAGLGRMLHKQ